MSLVYNWGLPGIDILQPRTCDGTISPQPSSWNQLEFTPIGIYDLRRHIGVFAGDPGIFQRYKHQFLGSDIVWFTVGSSDDGRHFPHPGHFFNEFDTLRSSGPIGQVGSDECKALREIIRCLTFDMVLLHLVPPLLSG
ncbi:hypothetical protein B0H10DRAFT_1943250 [Mycena sp. CBHHK59/15]|nr:hypothetical protein B0H10DRAFT_1943250 [Mycena sp. CBHHK59/15]